MNDLFDPKESETAVLARQGYTGRGLTNSQFEEAWALTGILARGIRKSGSFHEKLTDYAHAFARAEKFDTVKGETILRDLFKDRYGQTMNQMREGLNQRDTALGETLKEEAHAYARAIEPLIRDGETMPFFRAYDHAANAYADHKGITETAAKQRMQDAWRSLEGRELYETGKALEEKIHRPKREAERQQREAERGRDAEPGPTRSRQRA